MSNQSLLTEQICSICQQTQFWIWEKNMDWILFQNKSKGTGKVFPTHAMTAYGMVKEPWLYM